MKGNKTGGGSVQKERKTIIIQYPFMKRSRQLQSERTHSYYLPRE